MPILNQTNTGKAVRAEVAVLTEAIEGRDGGSMMQYIPVHCFTLAMVLDRLEYLESFYKEFKRFRYAAEQRLG